MTDQQDPAAPKGPARVFISAKSTDYEHARRVYHFLTSSGVPAFFSEQSLPELGSSDYRREIDRALDQADHMVVVASAPENLLASWVEAEWGFFINEKRSGRKRGNLVTLVTGGLRPTDLPPSLRYYEVLACNDEGLGRLLGYLRASSPAPHRPHVTGPASPGHTGFRELATFGGPPNVHLLKARPGANSVAAGGFDGAVRLYDVATRSRRAVIASERYWMMRSEGLITALEFSPDGRLLASGHLDGSVHVWEVDGGAGELARDMKHELAVSGFAFSPDGKQLTSVSKDGVLKEWDLPSAAISGAPPHSAVTKAAPIVWVVRLADRAWRVTGLVNSALRRTTIRIESEDAAATIALAEGFTTLTVSDDARLLVAGGWSGVVSVYDFALAMEGIARNAAPRQLQPIRQWQAHKKPLKSMELFPDGRRLATCAMESHATVWDIDNGKSLIRLQAAAGDAYASIAILDDGAALAAALADGRVRLWEAA